jgi:hypothetical protein
MKIRMRKRIKSKSKRKRRTLLSGIPERGADSLTLTLNPLPNPNLHPNLTSRATRSAVTLEKALQSFVFQEALNLPSSCLAFVD